MGQALAIRVAMVLQPMATAVGAQVMAQLLLAGLGTALVLLAVLAFSKAAHIVRVAAVAAQVPSVQQVLFPGQLQ